MMVMNFGPLALKMFLPLGAFMLASTTGVDWLSVIERWGIAGVWALVAFVLWKKQEKSDEVRLKLQQENHRLQLDNAIETRDLLRETVGANRNTAKELEALRQLQGQTTEALKDLKSVVTNKQGGG